jgi:two-component system cell cycle sensor histidine kinase/response regulator CckA
MFASVCMDEGVGIAEDDLPRVFEPFYTKKIMGQGGSGLGMTVIWSTVKDHGGYVDIRSREGDGTCFDIYLPATREVSTNKNRRVVLQDYIGTERILVVDDVPEQRDIAVRMLGKLGYACHISAERREGR